MTVTVGEAFKALGHTLTSEEIVCVVTITGNGVTQQSLDDVEDQPAGTNRYISSGTFPRNTNWSVKGSRSGNNVQRVLFLPFDFDLKDFLHISKQELFDFEDDQLLAYANPLRNVVESIFSEIGLPIGRMVYTGYGLAVHIPLPAHTQSDVERIREWHAAIVQRINSHYGETLADPSVKDAGSRIMRLPGSLNVGRHEDGRSASPRLSRILIDHPCVINDAMLRSAAGTVTWRKKRSIPVEGEMLLPVDAKTIIDIVSPIHSHGQRHFVALAVAGVLGKWGVPESQALAIVNALPAPDANTVERHNVVRDTYAKIRNGHDVSGFDVLRAMLSEHDFKQLTNIHDNGQLGPRLVFKRESDAPTSDVIKLFTPTCPPESAFYGWHARYRDLVALTTEAADAFHLSSSLALQGALMGRRIATLYAGDQVYANQFNINVGPTGNSRKDTAAKRAFSLVSHAQSTAGSRASIVPPYRLIYDVASRESMVRMLSRTSNILLFSTEITTVFKNATRESTSSLLDGLINVWDTPAVMQNNSIAAQEDESNIAKNPYMTIIGGIQPERLSREMTENMISSGLANRMAFFMGVAKGKFPRTPPVDSQRAHDLYQELTDAIQSYPSGTELVMSDEAGSRWDSWYLSQVEEVEETANDMKIRHALMIQKWALCNAVSDRAPFIELPHLQSAIDLCEWMWTCVKQVLPSWGVSPERKIEERILTVLQQRQPMLRRDLQAYVRGKWSASEFAKVFRAMKENQTVVTSMTDDRFVCLAEFAERQERGSA